MTQSGQGEEPSARPAREGIVLPSDGGEPLLPGRTGGSGGQSGGHGGPGGPGGSGGRHAAPQPTGQAPAGGQAWGQPWGPDQQQPQQESPAPQPGQNWPASPEQTWEAQEQSQPPAHAAWGTPQPGAGPLPPEGAQGAHDPGPGAHAPMPGGPGSVPGGHVPMPGAQAPYGDGGLAGGGAAPLPPAGAEAYGGGGAFGSPMPPAGALNGPQAQHGADGYGAQAPGGAPLPPAAEGATQYLPPGVVPAGATTPEGATQYLPPVPAQGGDEGATQYIPPVTPGALPPEQPAGAAGHDPAGHDPERTRSLGLVRRPDAGAPGAGPLPPAGGSAGPMPPAAGPDAQATQYIPPVAGGPGAGAGPYGVRPGGGEDRQPPSEFDNLFRSEPGGESPAAATQQLPLFSQPHHQPQPPYAAAQPAYAPQGPGHDGGRGRRGGRTGKRVPLLAAVGVVIAVLGVGAGAMLAGGGGDKGSENKPVSATAPTHGASASPSPDPAREQAVELDKLLADSGNSRTTVINAVAHVKACRDLPQAAKDLREAAKQRNQLVTRLSGLSVDKLPDHAALTTALTKAWQASAAADNHYAAWADQTARKKGCKKGKARVTGQTQAGNRASGTASTEKAEAARLWNAIAKTYGLTQRQPVQL
ncbi:hypothetical protein [Streptomyces sp. TRM68367]|uniref:hypothetical protein n=1 Tax=Streptomyces sp. TRM68367 TaxID=2758415 RepID=UPI00165CE8EF|nr:hypothetical protein [Streptomyces sp. TRM68367]MBC9727151.1 hypothetical protein [Streptomyces sp. TRM68367]